MTISATGIGAPLRPAGRTLGAQLAEQLEHEIRSGGWPVGHPIGSEAELTARFGVGVAAVREASRILTERGVARSRRGPGGGMFVTAPEREIVTDAARRYLDHSGVTGVNLFEAWLGLEQVAVRKLAGSIDVAGAARLRELLDAEREHGGLNWSGLPNVHLEIARLVGNPVLELFVQVLTDLSVSHYGSRVDPQRAADWVHARHAELVEAIIAGDAAMAQLHLRLYIESIIHSLDRPDATTT